MGSEGTVQAKERGKCRQQCLVTKSNFVPNPEEVIESYEIQGRWGIKVMSTCNNDMLWRRKLLLADLPVGFLEPRLML